MIDPHEDGSADWDGEEKELTENTGLCSHVTQTKHKDDLHRDAFVYEEDRPQGGFKVFIKTKNSR